MEDVEGFMRTTDAHVEEYFVTNFAFAVGGYTKSELSIVNPLLII